MSSATKTVARPAPRQKRRAPRSPLQAAGRLAARTAVILLVAGLIVAGATAVGYSPLGRAIPGTFLPWAGERGGDGEPPSGLVLGASAPGSEEASGASQPAGGSPSGQTGGARRAPGQAAGQQANGPAASASGNHGLFSGRNAPSLLRGWSEEVPSLATFAALAAAAALALRLVRPRRRRSAPLGLSPGA